MNIFVVDESPSLAARSLCDIHVSKMTLESAQILCSALSKVSGVYTPYKPTHVNHPCVAWAGQSGYNYIWLVMHAWALSREYTYRFGKVHKSQAVIDWGMEKSLGTGQLTPFVQCMPEEFKSDNAVEAYRRYYHSKKFAKWAHGREPPEWWKGALCK